MKGQFFVMSTVIMIYTLMTLVHYIYDFSDVNLIQLKKMSELNYIQDIKYELNKTVISSNQSQDCPRKIEGDINATETLLKNVMISRGINLTVEHNIICGSPMNVSFSFNLITPEIYTVTEFIVP